MIKRITTWTGIVVIAVLLAACGSSQNPTSPAPTDTPAAPASAIGPADTVAAPAVGTVNVAISGFAFDPATITIKAGESVTWTNKDSVVHTVKADDDSWTSGNLAKGETFTQTFSTAGTYKYFCSVHPNMTGTVIVQ